MIFDRDIDASIFNGIENKGISIDNKLATIIVPSSYDDGALASLRPIHMDLSLIHIFKESRERVRSTIKNCKLEFPLSRITVNIAPADIKKEGALYDLSLINISKFTNSLIWLSW